MINIINTKMAIAIPPPITVLLIGEVFDVPGMTSFTVVYISNNI